MVPHRRCSKSDQNYCPPPERKCASSAGLRTIRRLCSEALSHVLTRGGRRVGDWPLLTCRHQEHLPQAPCLRLQHCLRHHPPTPICIRVLALLRNWQATERLHDLVVMQQPPRLNRTQGDGRGCAGPSASVPVPPSTPRKKGEALNQLLRSLEDQYQLGFKVSGEPRSPINKTSAADPVQNRIQHLFYRQKPALDEALVAFATTATYIPQAQRLSALLDILRSKTQHDSPVSRAGTPLSARNVPPKTLKAPQPCKCNHGHTRLNFTHGGM